MMVWSTLPALDTSLPTHPSCPKCGARMDRMAFRPTVDIGYPGSRSTCVRYGCQSLDHDGEHLHRWCGACHYGVWERCLDDPHGNAS